MHSVLNESDSLFSLIAKAFTGKEKSSKDLSGTNPYTGGSISKYSKNLIMSFPLLCDAGVSLDTAMLVSKANERNIVNMLQLLFASMNIEAISGSNKGGADIIAAIYKDLDPNMSYNDAIDLLGKIAGDSDSAYFAKVNEAAIRDMMDQFRSQKPFRKENLNEQSISNFVVRNVAGKTVVAESDASDYYAAQNYALNVQKYNDQKKENEKKAQQANDQAAAKAKADDEKTQRNNITTQILTAQDAKKTNDLAPTIMVVNYNVVSEDEKTKQRILVGRNSFLAGVKSRFIPVDPIDIVERFVAKDRTKISLKNFIRATTGEISLFKDFLLCIDKIKIDARNSAKRGPLAQYWNILEKRSIKNNINKLKRKGNDGSPITTICISADSVNYMKNAYKFDLEDIQNAKMIMDSFNLLGLIIADEATEAIKVLYDGYNEFEVVSYSSLEKDMSDKNYKKIVNLINQRL